MTEPLVFASVYAALHAAHAVGDHWIQTHTQACEKAAPGRRGRLACIRHVATLTATKATALGVVALLLGLPVSPVATSAGLLIDAVSHYWADRRTTLVALADWLGRTIIPGKGEFARLGSPRADKDDRPHLGTGLHALDQSWHTGWLFVAALVVAIG